jgi:heme/copper-type cytochrome/quinol oxidase subunit 2
MKRFALFLAALLSPGLPVAAMAKAGSTDSPSIWIPPAVSAGGREIDHLYFIILMIVIVIFVATEGLLLFSVIKFRARPGVKAQYFHGSTSVELILAAIPAIILLFITLSSARLWSTLKLHSSTDKNALHVQVYAEQFAWNFRYAGDDATFGTADDKLAFAEGVVPVGRDVVFHISSKDVIHSFFMPESRMKQDAVPGLLTRAWTNWDHIPVWDLATQKRVLLTEEEFNAAAVATSGYKFSSKFAEKKAGWFQASSSDKINYLQYSYARDNEAPLVVVQGGKEVKAEPQYVLHYFEIGCAQLCGTSHFAMRGTMRVLPPALYEAWYKKQGAEGFLAEKWNGIWDKNHPEFNRSL